jgi:cobalt-zinc-cadmium efflux system membrane fusion protein
MKRFFLFLFFFFFGFEGSFSQPMVRISMAIQKALKIEAVPVQFKVWHAPIELPGTIVPFPGGLHELYSPVSGRILDNSLLPGVGSRVFKGETLALVRQILTAPEERQFELQSLELQNNSVQAEANLAKSKNIFLLRKKELERDEALYKLNAIALKDLQMAQTEYQNAFLDYQSAKKEAKAFELAVQKSKRRDSYRDFPILSPVSGIVSSLDVARGEAVSPQDKLFTVVDLSKVWVKVHVYESEISKIHPGESAVISPLAFPAKHFYGVVKVLGASLDAQNRTLPAFIEIENPGRLLKLGMLVDVKINTAKISSLFISPSSLVQENGKNYVFLKKNSDTFVRIPIVVRRKSAQTILVLKGVKPGDKVVAHGVYLLQDELQKASQKGKEKNSSEDSD